MDQSERIAGVPAGRFTPGFSCASQLWTRWENLLHREARKRVVQFLELRIRR